MQTITITRDLRSGAPPWRMPAVPLSTIPRTGPLTADVLVVGAGISGALVAETLAGAGLRVMIVDRRAPGRGATLASTALIQHDLDAPLSHLARGSGFAPAARIWQRSYLSVAALRDKVEQWAIPCAWKRRASLYLSGTLLDAGALRAEADARRRAALPAHFLDARQLRRLAGIHQRCAILSQGNYQCDPARLTAGILRAAVRQGARIFADLDVAGIAATRREVELRTSTDRILRARHVVFATGYELPRIVPRRRHSIHSTWAMRVKLREPRAAPPFLLWEASSPYLYVRPAPGGHLLCGGEDEPFSDAERRDEKLAAKTVKLCRKVGKLLPNIAGEVDRAWCGSFGASPNGTPTIGPIAGYRRCYAVLGYGGNGISFSMLAAQLLRSFIVGQPDPDAEWFGFRD